MAFPTPGSCMHRGQLPLPSSGIFRAMQVNHSDGFLSGTKLWPLSIDGFPGILEGRVLAAQPWNLLHHPLFTGCPFSSEVFISVLGLVSTPYICYFYFFFYCSFYLFFLIGVEFLCDVVLISVVQRSELVLCIHVPPPSWTSLPPLSPTHWGHQGALSRAPCVPSRFSLAISLSLFFFSFIFISWGLITLQYCSGFCHTLTWISHGVTCIPHPDPPLPPPSLLDPSGSSQCTRPEHLSHAPNLGWWSVSP